MKTKRIFLLLFLQLMIFHLSAQQYEDILSSWKGKLDLGTVSMQIAIHISLEGDHLKATMDSPDQSIFGFEASNITYADKLIQIEFEEVKGSYSGEFNPQDSSITGKWSQSGKSWPLNLEKGKIALPNRPQEPKPPYPYLEKEVSFKNTKEDFTLAGTLTMPDLRQPVPAVVLISGSGAQNRDSEILFHKPFKVIADHLTRNGIAVLRFDDRGFGNSEGDRSMATSADFATDVSAAVDFLLSQKGIIKDQIGLIGHSEGGMIAPMVAAQRDDIGFLVLLAGPGTTGRQILLDQTELILLKSGAKEVLVQDVLETNAMIYNILLDNEDVEKAKKKIRKKILKRAKKYTEAEKKSRGWTEEALEQNLNLISSPWFKAFLAHDPVHVLKQIKCPVLAVNGSKDLQVPPEDNLRGIENALKEGGNSQITVKEFPDLNHLFQHCETGLIAEYGQIEETFAPEVLEYMTQWMVKILKK
jgi:pimeloyl-ACP methyl ester carboxylesterase